MTEKHTSNTLQARIASQISVVSTLRYARRSSVWVAGLLLTAAMTGAMTRAQQPKYSVPAGGFPSAPQLQLPQVPQRPAITANGTVVEDVVARINDQIITRSEYQRAEEQMLQDAQQGGATESQLQDHVHDLLRDMIDSDLLISKGKELGITCDAETIRQLDDIRKQNHLPDMEALEKAASQQGVSFEDFKQNIRNQCIRQSVVRDEVGRHINMTHAQEEAYYAAHAKQFEVPEQVHLSEILVPTAESATDAQLAQAQAKADGIAAQLKGGASFADLAKKESGGPTAAAGGDLGDFKRGALGQVLEDATFGLPVGANTAPIRTRQGFVILRVDAHQAAGVPPLNTVENQVQEAIYMDQLQPALRTYLTKARNDAFIELAPGFVDTGSATKGNNSNFGYTAYQAPSVKRRILAKQRAEQARALKAQAALAAARERVAQKNLAKAEADKEKINGGKKNVKGQPKRKKIKREKIRYGQAPRDALPVATTVAADATPQNPALSGQAPGAAMEPSESVTSITTGVGADGQTADDSAAIDALADTAGPVKKTRFSAEQSKADVAKANSSLAKAETKAAIRPVTATREQSENEKVQAAPLGLNGDTVKKKKKPKAQKGDQKGRMQQNVKPVETPTTVAPTVNPTVTGAPAATTN